MADINNDSDSGKTYLKALIGFTVARYDRKKMHLLEIQQ
jgi:hypothetical protein